MKNSQHWKPSKFIKVNGKLRASRDVNEVTISSRFVANLVANQFDEYLKQHVSGTAGRSWLRQSPALRKL